MLAGEPGDHERSEEHTSELQSPCNLVCRLLLEKKKCFRMHEPMFNGHIKKLARRKLMRRTRSGIRRQHSFESCIKIFANASPVLAHISARRPILRLIGRQAAAHRINTEIKQLVELRIKPFGTEQAFSHQIPIESLEMPKIKNNAVTLRNRSLINRIRLYDIEKFIRSTSRLGE